MSSRKISQREALRLRRRVADLERVEAARTNRWAMTYPGGVHLTTVTDMPAFQDGHLEAASKMGAALVGRWDVAAKSLLIFAVMPR
jgi:hypothetical protein